MKKIISITLAIVMILACLPFSVFAQANPSEAHIKLNAARNKLYSQKESFTAAESYDFWLYLSAEGHFGTYKDAYIKSVKAAVKDGTIGDAANCALAILCLEKLGVEANALDIGESKVNLYELMESKGTEISSPYLYRYIFEAGESESFTSECLSVLDKDYTAGSGYDPWHYAFSCDTNASAGICYAASAKAAGKVADLASTLDSFKTANGYISETVSGWGGDPNVDSTACALAFFAYTGDTEKADEAYSLLKNFEVEGEEGAYFASYDPGKYNAYGTRDALIGLIEYCKLIGALEHDFVATEVAPKANAVGYTCYKCTCGELKKDASGNVIKQDFKSPTGKVTGVKCTARTAQALRITWNKVAGVSGYEVSLYNSANKLVKSQITKSNLYVFTSLAAGHGYKVRVRFYITQGDNNYGSKFTSLVLVPTLPKATKFTSVAGAKNAVVTKWARKAGVTGYQIQYASGAKFAGGRLKAIKGAGKYKLSLTNLKGGAKYYVRVRTFKTIGGKHYYSVWSAAKAVITKK